MVHPFSTPHPLLPQGFSRVLYPVNFAASLPRSPTAGPRADARCRALGGWQGEGRSQARRFQPSHQHKPSGILSGFGQTSPGRLRSAAASPPTSLGVTTHIKAWRFYCSIFQIGRLRGQKETKASPSWWRDGDFFKPKVSLRRAPGSPPEPGADAWVLPRSPPAADLGWGRRKRRRQVPGRGRARRQPALPYLGSKACPRRARRPEAPAGAGRPRRARGRPRRPLPSRTAGAAPSPAGLPPSAAPVRTALCLRPPPRPRGLGRGQARGGASGAPRAPWTVAARTPTVAAPAPRDQRRAGRYF